MTTKHVIFFGAAGSGKGTQSDFAIEAFDMSRISPGELARKIAASGDSDELSTHVAERLKSGELLDIEVVNMIIKKSVSVIHEDQKCKGIIFDGYPRSEHQDDFLRAGTFGDIEIDLAVYFEIDEKFLLERLSNRIVCQDCGAVFNRISKKTKVEGVCDECSGTNLLIRSDDNDIDAIQKRLSIFEKDTSPIMKRYEDEGKLVKINAGRSIDEVWEDTKSHLSALFSK